MAKAPKKTKAVEAVETVEVVEAVTAEAKPVKTRGPRGVDETAAVTVLVPNPKREGSKAYAVFACYETGKTIAEIADAVTASGADINYLTPCLVYDAKHGFIQIEGYNPGEITPPKPKKEPNPEKKGKKAKVEKTTEQVEAEGAVDVVVQEEALM